MPELEKGPGQGMGTLWGSRALPRPKHPSTEATPAAREAWACQEQKAPELGTRQCHAFCRDRHEAPLAPESPHAWHSTVRRTFTVTSLERDTKLPKPTALLSHEGEGQKTSIFNSSVAHFLISLCHYKSVAAAVPATRVIDSLVLSLDPSDG